MLKGLEEGACLRSVRKPVVAVVGVMRRVKAAVLVTQRIRMCRASSVVLRMLL